MKKLMVFLITTTLFTTAVFAQSAEVEERLLDAEKRVLEAERKALEAEKRAVEAEKKAIEAAWQILQAATAEKREETESSSASTPVVASVPKGPLKVSVYVTGVSGMAGKVLNKAVSKALEKSKVYAGIIPIDQFVSGAANDQQISGAGKRAGVHFVFVINATQPITVRIVDTETASVTAQVSIDGEISAGSAGAIAKKIVDFLLKSGPGGVAVAKSSRRGDHLPGEQFNPNIEYSSFTDSRDGRSYRAVKIGNLTWMAENLNYVTNNSGCYGRDNYNCEKYGRLYTWDAAMSACPSGWRLPSRQDWNDLISAAGRELKSRVGWKGRKNKQNSDVFGFSALPGGFRSTGGSFWGVSGYGRWWSATEYGSGSAWYRSMHYYYDDFVFEFNYNKSDGFSARCVRDI